MSEFFSNSWHKISKLQVTLSKNAKISKQYYKNKPWYIIQEPYSGKYYRASEETYSFLNRLDGIKTIDDIWEELISSSEESLPTQGEIVELLGSLYVNSLLEFKTQPDSDIIYDKEIEKHHNERKNKLLSMFYFKLPLFNPNKFLNKMIPIAKILFSPVGLICWIGILYIGINSVVSNLELLSNESEGFLAPSNLLFLYISIAILKSLHELSHSLAIKKFGGNVNSIGINFIVLTPLPYMDATHSWFFSNKYQRILVSLAGILSDLFFAAIFGFIWANTSDGILHSISFNLMIAGSISSILFNGNPLLKFDAYYVLADYLEIPNLYNKSRDYVVYLIEQYIFRIENLEEISESLSESLVLSLYWLLSFVYRVVIAIGIIFYIGDQFFILGLMIFAISFYIWLIAPVQNLFTYLQTSQKLYKKRALAKFIIIAFFITIIWIYAYVPLPRWVDANGIIEEQNSTIIHAQTEGILEHIYVKNGDYVKKGQLIAKLNNQDLTLEIVSVKNQILQNDIMKTKFLSLGVDTAPLYKQKKILINKLNFLYNNQRNLNIVSTTNGIFYSNEINFLKNSWLKKQTKIGSIMTSSDFNFKAVLSQENSYDIFNLDKIDSAGIKFYGAESYTFEVLKIVAIPYQKDKLPSAALGWFGGGAIAVATNDKSGVTSSESFYELRIKFIDTKKNNIKLLEGRSGVVRIRFAPETLHEQLYKGLAQLIQKRYKI